MLQTQRGPLAVEMVQKLAGQCFRSLRKLGMREEIDKLLAQMANVVLDGQDLDTLVKKIHFKEDSPAPLQALLDVASSWYYFGRDHQADAVLQAVRAILFKAAYPPLKQRDLACAYARTVGQTNREVAKTRLEEIFRDLKGVKDSFTSGSHFSVCQLDLIESVVLAVVSDDFAQGTQARRWLDDDEFLVRRRIHDDHRKMVGKGGE
jgi:cellulose synthase operon protein C